MRKIIFFLLLALFIIVFLVLPFYIIPQPVPVSSPGRQVSVKGGEIETLNQWATYQPQIARLNVSWVRIHIKWSAIETSPGVYDYTSQEYQDVKNAVVQARSMGAEVILDVKDAPQDALETTPYSVAADGAATPWPQHCGRISVAGDPSGTDRLKLFLVAVIHQLAADMQVLPGDPPPIRYIELWNEPDAPAYQTATKFFGCWGKDPSQTNGTPAPFEAGVYYARVLNAIAPYVRQQFLQPGTQASYVHFVAGATGDAQNGFLDPVISQALDNFDVISYHIYANTNNSYCDLAAFIQQEDDAFVYVRKTLDEHSGSAKSILISEGAMGYVVYDNQSPTPTPAASFYACQAQFAGALLDWAKSKETSANLLGFIWYTIARNGWHDTDLFFARATPKPVYYVWEYWLPSAGFITPTPGP